MVAPSFQSMKQIGEPFPVSGKMYVRVLNEKTNHERTVRWYDEAEYRKAYPSQSKPTIVASPTLGTQKAALGFSNGPITIFKGASEDDEDYFRISPARYCVWWGWYLPNGAEPLADLPSHISSVALNWEDVGNPNGALKPEAKVREVVDALLYDSRGVSEYVGTPGERREFVLTVIKNVSFDNGFGKQHLHTFNDEAGNEYIWITATKSWDIGKTMRIKGTIKGHQTYEGVRQTVLTRCAEVGK